MDPQYEDENEARKARNKNLLKGASKARFFTPKKKTERRDYNKVRKKKPGRNRRVMAIKGSVESKEDVPIERIVETKRDTARFMKKTEKPMYSPVVTTQYLDPYMVTNLKEMGVTFRINHKTMPNSLLITMNKRKISLIDLNNMGIVVDRPNKNTVAISPYDLLFLLERGYLGNENKRRKAYNEVFTYLNRQDPNYLEKYVVYRVCKHNGYIVMDGVRYGYDFVIYEEPSDELLDHLNHIDKNMIGPGKPVSGFGLAGVDLILRGDQEIEVQEIIKGQHLTDKDEMRYKLADVVGKRDSEGHLIMPSSEVKLHGIRLNKLNLNKFNTPGRDAIIIQREDTEE